MSANTLNDRLSSYLATAQSQSETAYAAMQSAYAFWRDLMAAQPAGEGVSFLRQVLTDASRAFDATHAAYHDALLNADNPNLLSSTEAWQQRNASLLALAVAQGQWAGSVGPVEDEDAIRQAYDQVGVALDNFDTATLEYADAVDNLSVEQSASDGLPFLEVHHLRQLADRGSDTVSNAVALCPNCHREAHYGEKSKALIARLYERVARLVRE